MPIFRNAMPIWADQDDEPRYATAGFRTVLPGPGAATLRITACNAYRAWLNGDLVFHGPARSARGHFRVDEVPLSLQAGDNLLAIEVVGYGVNAFSHMVQPPFLQAEVEAEGVILASTGSGGFEACVVPGRARKVQRYSYMRPMSEVYRLVPGWDDWRTNAAGATKRLATRPAVAGMLLERRTPPPTFDRFLPINAPIPLRFDLGSAPEKPKLDRSVTHIGTELEGYHREEWEAEPWFEAQQIDYSDHGSRPATTFDFGVNRTGFIQLAFEAQSEGRLLLAFDEIATDGVVNPHRLGCINLIQLSFQPGSYEFESFEPYTFRHLTLLEMEGEVSAPRPSLREFSHPDSLGFAFSSSDQDLNQVVDAAVETLRQNSLDFFMDCPHRERGGYLCDSFFTARAYQLVFGHTAAEDAFLENYLVAETFDGIPAGMVPMCYPSDPLGGTYIPQWGMWLVVQLADYAVRGGDRALVDRFQPRLSALMKYLKQFENEEGLLESMPGWNFVEWSDANKWVQPINFPTQMLYAAVLRCFEELYGSQPDFQRPERLLETVRRWAGKERFFVDNATRVGGKLQPTENRSEVCQYFAFFFGAASPETHAQLWHELTHAFGPHRKASGAHPEVAFANAFIGNMLRLELLPAENLEAELLGYFAFMAKATGTLWENDGAYASCNHGFASYAAVLAVEKILGVRVHHGSKRVETIPVRTGVANCEVTLPTQDGPILARREDEQVTVKVPPGWRTD